MPSVGVHYECMLLSEKGRAYAIINAGFGVRSLQFFVIQLASTDVYEILRFLL